MKKLLTTSLVAVLVLISGAVYATNTRVMTMGETGNIQMDESNVFMYPSRINMYPDLAMGEMGYSNSEYDDGSGMSKWGIHWKFGEKNPWILGTYLARDEFRGTNYDGRVGIGYLMLPFRYPTWVDLYDYGWFDWPSTPTSNEGNQRVSLIYGRKLGNNPFGFRFSKFHSSWKDEGNAGYSKAEEGLAEYDFAFGLTEATGKWDVAAGINMLTWTNKNFNGEYSTKPSGNKALFLHGRYFKQVNPRWTIVPNAGVIMGSYEAEFYTGATPNVLTETESFKTTTFWAGMGAHYTPVANVLAVCEGGFGYNSSKWEYKPVVGTSATDKINFLTFPYLKIGFEGQVFDWLDLRGGATSYWQKAKEEFEPNPNGIKYSANYPDNATYLGTGMHFGNLHIDTYTNPEILLNGFDFISGNSTSSLNTRVSVLYTFK